MKLLFFFLKKKKKYKKKSKELFYHRNINILFKNMFNTTKVKE